MQQLRICTNLRKSLTTIRTKHNELYMLHISLSPRFKELCPSFRGIAFTADVTNTPTSEALWREINEQAAFFRERYTTDDIKLLSGIQATRAAYKAAGKDPSRYRPSNEQLARRILQGKDLYSISTIVDLGNLISLVCNYSVGAINAGKLEGTHICLDFGEKDEPYEGIGRGALNIEHLPVYRDAAGPFATPTSDSTRTMMQMDTHRLLLLINAYDGDLAKMEHITDFTLRKLAEYAHAENIEHWGFGNE